MSLIGWWCCAFKLGLEMFIIFCNDNVVYAKQYCLDQVLCFLLHSSQEAHWRSPRWSLMEQGAVSHSFLELSWSPWTTERASEKGWPIECTEVFKSFFLWRIGVLYVWPCVFVWQTTLQWLVINDFERGFSNIKTKLAVMTTLLFKKSIPYSHNSSLSCN